MTPERKAWWDSLPKEEKVVRLAIKKEKSYMSFYKSDGALNIRGFIKFRKLLIKALRKQIGLCPIDRASRNDPTGSCPTCNDLVIRREHDCCAGCGQKLRWNDD